MSTLDDLKARARSAPRTAACVDLRVTLERVRGVDSVTNALSAYFGADDTRQEARVIVDGEVVGYFSREDVDELLDFKEKGIGLPGNPTMRDKP